MDEIKNIETLPGSEVPLPPENPIEEGIVAPDDIKDETNE